MDDEDTSLEERRKGEKRESEVPLEDIDPAMVVRESDTHEGAARMVGALEVIEAGEPSDPEEDDESNYVAGGELDRAEARHRGRLEELKRMEFSLYTVVSRH